MPVYATCSVGVLLHCSLAGARGGAGVAEFQDQLWPINLLIGETFSKLIGNEY